MQNTITPPSRKQFIFRPANKKIPQIVSEGIWFNTRAYRDTNGNWHDAKTFDRDHGRPGNLPVVER